LTCGPEGTSKDVGDEEESEDEDFRAINTPLVGYVAIRIYL
jgi:hypothetical protein